MRILFLTHRLPYAPNRGDRIRAYHLARLLASAHDVHVVSLVHDKEEAASVSQLAPMVASVTAARVSRQRLVSAALAQRTSRPLTHVLLHSPAITPILQRLVATIRPHLVLAYCTGMARYAFEPTLAPIPCVLDMVDVDSEKWSALAQTTRGPLRHIYRREADRLRAFERQAVQLAAATTVVSDRERMVLEAIAPGSRPVVVPNGVDVVSFAPPDPPASDPQAIFCGAFNYGPNVDGAVWLATKVWPAVTRQQPRARLALVGMEPVRAVRALSRDPSIVVTGTVPDVRPYLWQSAIAVAPLHVARGVQNKVLEAAAAGLPSVVTPQVLDGLPATARLACRSATDPEAFAAAIVSLLEEPAEARRQMAAQVNLQELSWEAQLAPMLDLVACIG